jgi:hypothetical protein
MSQILVVADLFRGSDCTHERGKQRELMTVILRPFQVPPELNGTESRAQQEGVLLCHTPTYLGDRGAVALSGFEAELIV